MTIGESRSDRLARYEAKLAALPRRDIHSAEELGRAESARAARHHGFAQPAFRTSVRLRFSGDGVIGHDLRGSLAGDVIGEFSGVVEAAAQDAKVGKDAASLFLSPVVTPGSTILELFGPEVPQSSQEKLDTEIDDGPTDIALSRVFSLLDVVNFRSLGSMGESELDVGPNLANRLFALSNELIDAAVDLGLVWTRPRGTRREAEFSRTTAYGFRAVLDVETTQEVPRTETGMLSYISTDGSIGFRYGNKRQWRITLDASNIEQEKLRGLWASEVTLVWNELVTTHPRRRVAPKVERTVIDVRPHIIGDWPSTSAT
jgi:hypothetical protein